MNHEKIIFDLHLKDETILELVENFIPIELISRKLNYSRKSDPSNNKTRIITRKRRA